MKKLLLLGAAAMMTLAVNAQSIEALWTIPADAATGLCSARCANGFGDTLFGANNTAGTIEEWKDGKLVASYDVNKFCTDNQLGEMVDEKDEAGNVTGQKFQAYTLWTAVNVDDAGNILANVGLGAGSSTTCQNWILLPAEDRTKMQLLHIDEFPSADVTLGRVDVPANIVGDIATGAYMYIPATGSALLPVMYIGLNDEGKIYYDTDSSWALLAGAAFDSSTNVATFQTKDEMLSATEEGEIAADTYVRWRGQGAPFTWDAESSSFIKNATITQGAGTPGMGLLEYPNAKYIVLPAKTNDITVRGSSVMVCDLATGDTIATWNANTTVDYYVGSVTSRISEDGTAYIYVAGHKDCFGILKFTAPASSIEAVATDVNAPVEYYNLQGMKVANAKNGLFIKKQGNKAVKVVL